MLAQVLAKSGLARAIGTLAKLHLVIQAAFGWDHPHLHEFIAGDGER